jgi:hypothetical protein
MYVCGVKEAGSRTARGEANIMQDGAVDVELGTGTDGNSYLYVQAHYPK